ncbi:MAG: HD domain-containing protein [Flavobacterium sp.]|nr:HD domain-containing protein [Flavobacterium sp.]
MLHKPESEFILRQLTNNLAAHLRYHTVNHTLDVYNTATMIAANEKISAKDTKLLLIAALYHDAGYLYQSKGHEAISCKIAAESLPQFGYKNAEINQICNIITATKIPQQPHSQLEMIICDADLDYLGRNDFFEIGHQLYLEMLASGTVTNEKEWNLLQVVFLQQHRYFTQTSQQLRNDKKQENLTILLSKTAV